MRQMQPILWTKGLMLTPQHLQTQDRFLEDVLEFRLSSHAFCPWGFRALEIDREALAQGAFAISAAEGVFPDGLLFSMPDSDPPPAPKPLDEYWGEDRESMQLHLALPERRLGGFNVSVDRENGSTRFLAEAILRRDENTGASERPIQIARKNLRLLTEVENLDGFSVLPVAKVTRAPTGEYRLDGTFIPPAVDISANEHLMAIARRLLELLSAKSSGLSGMRREMRKGLADFGISDVANFWLLYTVNSHLAYLRHLYETRKGHPGVLYGAMLSLAGALTTFSTSIRPTDLPSYDHGDLTDCFTRLDENLRELLETVVPESHVTLPLKTTEEPSIYATRLDQERYLQGLEMYLAISADMQLEELIADVPRLVKVSSGDRVDRLIHQAIEGLALRYVPDPPRSLPVKLDYRYFRLDRSGADWDAIRMARSLAAYVPTRFPSPRLELVILLPPED